MSAPSSPRSPRSPSPKSTSSDSIHVNHPDPAMNMNPQSPPSVSSSPSSALDSAGLSDISSLDAEEMDYDMIDSLMDSNSESGTSSNQQNHTIRTSLSSTGSTEVQSESASGEGTDREGISSISLGDDDHQMDASTINQHSFTSSSSDYPKSTIDSASSNQFQNRSSSGRNDFMNSTPNQSHYYPTSVQHSDSSSPIVAAHNSSQSNPSPSRIGSSQSASNDSEPRRPRASVSPHAAPINQSHPSIDDHQGLELDQSMTSSSNLSFPDPLGQSFLVADSSGADQTVASGRKGNKEGRRDVGVQVRWQGQDADQPEEIASEDHRFDSGNVETKGDSAKQLPHSDSFTFLSDHSTSPSIQTQNLSLSPDRFPQAPSEAYACITRGANPWKDGKLTHNRHPWHVENSDKSASSQEAGASSQEAGRVERTSQTGLGLDTLGEEPDYEGCRIKQEEEDLEVEEGYQSQDQDLRDSWSDIQIDEAVSTHGNGSEYDGGFCPSPRRPSANLEVERQSDSGDSHLTGSGKGGNIAPALIISGKLSKSRSTSTDPQVLEVKRSQREKDESEVPKTESLTIVYLGLNQCRPSYHNLKSTFKTSATAITQSLLLSIATGRDWDRKDGVIDEISRTKSEDGAEEKIFEARKKDSDGKTVVRTLDLTLQDPVNVSVLKSVVEANPGETPVSILVVATLSNGEKASQNLSSGLKELSKALNSQGGLKGKVQVHLLPVHCPTLPNNNYDGDYEDEESVSSESNVIVQNLTRQADLQTTQDEWDRVLNENNLRLIESVKLVKPFGKVMIRVEDLLNSDLAHSEWILELVKTQNTAGSSPPTSKLVLPQTSLAAAMGMGMEMGTGNRKSLSASMTCKPSGSQARPPTWLSKTLSWLPVSAIPISNSSSSSSRSSDDAVNQRERERQSSPTEEGLKHEAIMDAQEYLEQIDKEESAEAQRKMEAETAPASGWELEVEDEEKAKAIETKTSDLTPTKLGVSSFAPSSNLRKDVKLASLSPSKSSFGTSLGASSRFSGSPEAKALLERSKQLRKQRRQQLKMGSELQQESWSRMRPFRWVQNAFESGEGRRGLGLSTSSALLLLLVTSVVILLSRNAAFSSVFQSNPSSTSDQDHSGLDGLTFTPMASLNKFESSALSLASSSKAKALALFESGTSSANSYSNLTISYAPCNKNSLSKIQSKELSTHLHDDFSNLVKNGSQSASDWISGKVPQSKTILWNSSSKALTSTNKRAASASKALADLKEFASKFLHHVSAVANELSDSVRKEWEAHLQEMLRIWKIVMELAQDFQHFSRPYRRWIFNKSKQLSVKIAENGRNLSNEIDKLEIKNQILKQVERQRANLSHRRRRFQAQNLKTRKEILKYCQREVEDDRKEEIRLREELYRKEVGSRISLFKNQEADADVNADSDRHVRRSERLKSKSKSKSKSSHSRMRSSNTGQPLNAKDLVDSDRDVFLECIKRKARKIYEDRSAFDTMENAFQSAITSSVDLKASWDRLVFKAGRGGEKLKNLTVKKLRDLKGGEKFHDSSSRTSSKRVRRQRQLDLFRRTRKDRSIKQKDGKLFHPVEAGRKRRKAFWK